jgi:hypothetical protein
MEKMDLTRYANKLSSSLSGGKTLSPSHHASRASASLPRLAVTKSFFHV